MKATRLPEKPLLKETGKYLVQHVYEQAKKARSLDVLLIATDDQRIADAVREFGGKVVMTPPECPSGTDRAALASKDLDVDFVLNIQGDEPEMDPAAIDAVVEALKNAPDAVVATPVVPSADSAEAKNPNVVKVAATRDGRALYFSRSPIPHYRDAGSQERYLFHLGLYGYRKNFLMEYTKLKQTPLELAEKLEQLRILENGYKIAIVETKKFSKGIDTPADYAEFVARYKKEKK